MIYDVSHMARYYSKLELKAATYELSGIQNSFHKTSEECTAVKTSQVFRDRYIFVHEWLVLCDHICFVDLELVPDLVTFARAILT